MQKPLRRRPMWAAALLGLVAMCASAALPSGRDERGPQHRVAAPVVAETEARVIVKFRADSQLMRAQAAGAQALAPRHAQALSARLGLSLSDGRAIGSRTQVLKGQGLSSRQLADRMAAQADVEYAVVDERKRVQLAAPNDSLFPGGQTSATPAVGQWYLRAPTSSVVSAINAPAAWDITTGSSSVVVAVLDTGVRMDHPDLAGKLLAGYDFIHDAATANDGDVRDADPSDPGDYVTSGDVGVVPGCTSGDVGSDSSWHGTQTAGLIGAATNNGEGMASIGRDVKLLPLRVLGKCGGWDSDIQAAMLWAGGIAVPGVPANPNPAKVINMSLGSSGACSPSYVDVVGQLNRVGVVVVAAAGNEGLAVGTPANCPGVIAVAGVRHAGTKVGYSDLGTEVAIAAPAGNCVNSTGTCLFPLLTTANKGATTPSLGAAGASYTGGGDDASLGTSFSAPLVAGTIGLMFSANPALTPAQVLSHLKLSARTFPQPAGVGACVAPSSVAQTDECYCTTSTCGAGLLDAGAAVERAATGVAVANIGTLTTVIAGDTLALSGTSSRASATSATVQTYAWSVLAGASVANISGAANASTATLATSAAGTVVVSLTVTDSAGKTATTSTTLTVAPPTSASIAASASTVAAGDSISLDGTASHAASGSIVSYQWVVTSGATFASFSGPTNASTATLLTGAAGNVVVSLTVTDSVGKTATTNQALVVIAAPTPPPSSGGGGAMELGWLLGWLASVIGVRAVTPRRGRD